MTRQPRTRIVLAILTVTPALVGLAGDTASANPDFGSERFMWHLQEDLGIIGPSSHHRPKRPCPTVRGVPVPATWGPQWRPHNDWMRHIDRHGYPPARHNIWGTETPDQKWHQTVKRYRAWLMQHPYDGSGRWHRAHAHFLQHLEHNWYNYWHRLRYGSTPPNHDSHYFGWGYGREGW